ncbi:OmpA family protein [Echinimonas agarilytica]|uniref:OmpA family protein n=1 Tax=Echinimonas agarilytica TaxID=1215918 RepID=A0AA41W7E5_9GAMM|nr:OmpA family protein [Echinimonas agarilytica]MCM2680101.1 OmpA family protein [Echinimonas agarilytica]
MNEKLGLVPLVIFAISGCAFKADLTEMEALVTKAEMGSEGRCIELLDGVEQNLRKAKAVLAKKPSDVSFGEYEHGMKAAHAAVQYRQEYDEHCLALSQAVKDSYSHITALPGVNFADGSDQLTLESSVILDAMASKLLQEQRSVEVAGHTSNTGTPEFNMSLSQRRADAVRAYLISRGVSASLVVAKGYGMEQPVAANDSRVGQSANRRVEIRYLEP